MSACYKNNYIFECGHVIKILSRLTSERSQFEVNQEPGLRISSVLKRIAMSMKSGRTGTIKPRVINCLCLKVKMLFVFSSLFLVSSYCRM